MLRPVVEWPHSLGMLLKSYSATVAYRDPASKRPKGEPDGFNRRNHGQSKKDYR